MPNKNERHSKPTEILTLEPLFGRVWAVNTAQSARLQNTGIEGGWHMSIYVCITQHEFSHWGTLYTLHSRPGTIFPSWYGPMEGHVGIKAHTGLFSTSSYHQNAVALSFYLPGLFSHGGCEKQQRCTKT